MHDCLCDKDYTLYKYNILQLNHSKIQQCNYNVTVT